MVSVGNKQVRKPKADGWFEHGQVCCQYLELNFGSGPAKPQEPDLVLTLPSRPRGGMGWAG
jgi:hypothetical protein